MLCGSGHKNAQTRGIAHLHCSVGSKNTSQTEQVKRYYIHNKKRSLKASLPDRTLQYLLSPCYIQQKRLGGDP